MGRLRASYSSQRGNTSGHFPRTQFIHPVRRLVLESGGQAFTPWDDEYGGFTGVPRAFAFAPAFHNGLLNGSHLLSQFQHLGDAVPVAAGARHVKHLSDLGPTEF